MIIIFAKNALMIRLVDLTRLTRPKTRPDPVWGGSGRGIIYPRVRTGWLSPTRPGNRVSDWVGFWRIPGWVISARVLPNLAMFTYVISTRLTTRLVYISRVISMNIRNKINNE